MRSRYVLIAVAIALLLTVAVGGVAIAKQTGIIVGKDEVKACYNNQNGNLRVVERASDCRNNEGFTSWDRSGGGLGSGQLQTQVIQKRFTIPDNGSLLAQVDCPTGQIVTGGGYTAGILINQNVTGSFPFGNSGWAVDVVQARPDATFDVYAVCLPSQ